MGKVMIFKEAGIKVFGQEGWEEMVKAQGLDPNDYGVIIIDTYPNLIEGEARDQG